MAIVPDEQLYAYAERVKGTVVLITGIHSSSSELSVGSTKFTNRCCEWNWQRDSPPICKIWVSPALQCTKEDSDMEESINHSAKVVIGDRDTISGERTVADIVKAGG
jgi:hypothetical protein